jgi:hypothetical protein
MGFIKTSIINDDGELESTKVRKLYDPFQKNKGYKLWYKSDHIRTYFNIKFPKTMTDSEIGKITRLSKEMNDTSNLLAKRVNNEAVPMTREDIQEIIGVSRNRFCSFMSKVKKEGILRRTSVDGKMFYCFNPLYYNTTNYIDLGLYITFQDELQKHLPPEVIEKYLDWQRVNKLIQKKAASNKDTANV